MPVARYWRYQVQRYRLVGNRCTVCGRVYFPKRVVCSECHRKSLGKMEDVELSGNGRVLSYTVVHDAPRDYMHQVPYILALVEMEEGPVIVGQIVDAEPGEVSVGKEVTAVFRRLREEGRSGTIQYGYKFRLR